MKWQRACFALVGAVLAVLAGAAPPAAHSAYDAAWADTARLLIDDAHRAFADADADAVPGSVRREARLGEAVTELNLQPRTDQRIVRARHLLEGLAAEHVRDDVDVFARFFLARLLELHARVPDPAAARQLYRELFDAYPGNPLAERAAAQLVLIDIYADIAPKKRERRLAALEQLGPRLKTASGRRDFYLNLGNARIDFGLDPARALDDLLVADRAGITQSAAQANTWIAVGELARVTGQSAVARTYYERFLAAFPLDSRRTTIAQRLASLPANTTSTAPHDPPPRVAVDRRR